MQNGREDSVWRALAVAFGDGLAFGVGMNLTQNAVRLAAGRARPELQPLADRVAAIEQRIDRAKANGSLPSPAELDARITEVASQFERNLAEVEVKVKIQIEALHARDRALAQELETQMKAFREQMIALQREFAETLSRLVEEQIEAGVLARLAPIEESLRGTARDEAKLTAEALSAELETRLAPLEEQIRAAVRDEVQRAKEDLARDLEQRLAARDQSVLQLMLTLGQTCLETAERMAPAAVAPTTPALE
jgi:hypothetical protein